MPRVPIKRKRFTIPTKYLLLMMTVVCVGLMVLTFYTDWIAGPLSRVSGYVLVPFQKGIATAGSWLTDQADALKELKDVIADNAAKQEQIDSLTLEVNSLQQERYELARLRELYELDKVYGNYEKIGARVIGKDTGNWFARFLIDKGTDDGLAVNMNVIAGSGLVGRIISVGSNWALVQSIIDDDSDVSAQVLSTEDRMIVSGDLELMNDGVIRFSQLDDEDGKVAVGDKIVTSQISSHYLPGILIGYVSDIYVESNNLTKSGRLTTAVDFKNLQEVLVILEVKQRPAS